jgi:nitroreductase
MENQDRINLTTDSLKNLLWESQRCQRNWDLTKNILDADVEALVNAIKSSPSKQNEKHFKVYVVSNYDARKKIYDHTRNFAHDADGETLCFNPDGTINYKHQSQLMGNLLFVFCRDKGNIYRSGESYCGSEFLEEDKNVPYAGTVDLSTAEKKKKVQSKYNAMGLHAIGISVGYLLVTAHLLGYKTGCSSGFDPDTVIEVTGNEHPEIIVAVGYSDDSRDRREEHFERGRLFPSFNKEILVEWIK